MQSSKSLPICLSKVAFGVDSKLYQACQECLLVTGPYGAPQSRLSTNFSLVQVLFRTLIFTHNAKNLLSLPVGSVFVFSHPDESLPSADSSEFLCC